MPEAQRTAVPEGVAGPASSRRLTGREVGEASTASEGSNFDAVSTQKTRGDDASTDSASVGLTAEMAATIQASDFDFSVSKLRGWQPRDLAGGDQLDPDHVLGTWLDPSVGHREVVTVAMELDAQATVRAAKHGRSPHASPEAPKAKRTIQLGAETPEDL